MKKTMIHLFMVLLLGDTFYIHCMLQEEEQNYYRSFYKPLYYGNSKSLLAPEIKQKQKDSTPLEERRVLIREFENKLETLTANRESHSKCPCVDKLKNFCCSCEEETCDTAIAICAGATIGVTGVLLCSAMIAFIIILSTINL